MVNIPQFDTAPKLDVARYKADTGLSRCASSVPFAVGGGGEAGVDGACEWGWCAGG
jgi:hypothetical protein